MASFVVAFTALCTVRRFSWSHRLVHRSHSGLVRTLHPKLFWPTSRLHSVRIRVAHGPRAHFFLFFSVVLPVVVEFSRLITFAVVLISLVVPPTVSAPVFVLPTFRNAVAFDRPPPLAVNVVTPALTFDNIVDDVSFSVELLTSFIDVAVVAPPPLPLSRSTPRFSFAYYTHNTA